MGTTWITSLLISALVINQIVSERRDYTVTVPEILNDRVIIGVLSQEQSFYLHTKYPQNYTSYIAASYVKDIESAGARVVPIMIGKDEQYYRNMVNKINGVFLPGGATYFNQSGGYAEAGGILYDLAKELNDGGTYFPMWGTCLGFELLVQVAAGDPQPDENRVVCSCSGVNLPLNFRKGYERSKMFSDLPSDIFDILRQDNVTVNAHNFCILDENLEAHNMSGEWRALTDNQDLHGVTFVSSFEHTKYPFYGVQFHPEKNSFEWKASKNYPHSSKAVKANRYFMEFFVSEARRNNNSYSSASAENAELIYAHEATFTGAVGSAYHQCYMFEPRNNIIQ